LRTAGKYKSARHKFEKALKIDENNSTAKYELKIVENLIYFDKMLPTDATLRMRQPGQDNSSASG
jgi:Tfp pilus assembly protein PilF